VSLTTSPLLPVALASLALLGATVASAQPAGRTIVVAQLHPAADDKNPGTADAPLKSIGAAVQLVQPGDTVLIQDGVYRELVKIEVSGTTEAPIRFEAAPMAQVTVTGAEQLTDWRREEGEENVFSTDWPY